MELLSWVSDEQITTDGGVTKRTVQLAPDQEWENPDDETQATVNYTLRLEDGTLIEERNGFEFVVGAEASILLSSLCSLMIATHASNFFYVTNKDVVEGLDRAIRTMKKGERAFITVKPTYAYGEKGSEEKQIPPNATLVYEIELLHFISVPLLLCCMGEGESCWFISYCG